jgi:hypothetical protein
MKHLLEFESYGPVNEAATIPVYNEDDYIKSPGAPPEMKVPAADIVEIIGILLGSKDQGKIDMVVVNADLPSQGKNAPAYIRTEMDKERERMAKRKYSIYGSRIEKDDRPEDDYTDAINIFVDSEYVVTGVQDDAVMVIPRSYYVKTQRDPSLVDQYTLALTPDQIEEVSYYPAK